MTAGQCKTLYWTFQCVWQLMCLGPLRGWTPISCPDTRRDFLVHRGIRKRWLHSYCWLSEMCMCVPNNEMLTKPENVWPFCFPLPRTARHLMLSAAIFFINSLPLTVCNASPARSLHPSHFKTSIKAKVFEMEIYSRVARRKQPQTCIDWPVLLVKRMTFFLRL